MLSIPVGGATGHLPQYSDRAWVLLIRASPRMKLSFPVGFCACPGNTKLDGNAAGGLYVRSRQNARHALAYRTRLLHAFQILHSPRARRLAYGACVRKHDLQYGLLAFRRRFLLGVLPFARSLAWRFAWSHNIRTCLSMIRSLLSYVGPSDGCMSPIGANKLFFFPFPNRDDKLKSIVTHRRMSAWIFKCLERAARLPRRISTPMR